MRIPLRLQSALTGPRSTLVLLALLLAINTVAIGQIVSSRRNARELARREIALRTTGQGRALEALLATLRGDFIFLSESPSIGDLPEILRSSDPMARRWGRLNAEGSVLLFLQSHPAVEHLVVRDPIEEALIVAGRRQGAPLVLPPDNASPSRRGSELVRTFWPTRGGAGEGSIEAWLDPGALLSVVAPDLGGDRLQLLRSPLQEETIREGDLVALVAVEDEGWNPPIRWTLVRRQEESRLLDSVESLAVRYRGTVFLNLAVVSLTLVLGALAFREVRRAARAEAEYDQQSRVRELERQLLHSERLATVGRLAAGMAHEINNPLEGMANYLEILESDLEQGDGEAAAGRVGKIREGLERAAGITRQVLTFSDPARAAKRPLDVNRTVEDAVEFVRSNPAFGRIQVRLKKVDSPVAVNGNPITLGQLFLNLMLNACEAQNGSGQLEVSVRREDQVVMISVADTGPGLEQEVLDHLFEPFFSTRGSTGLGLAVCHGIVKDHDGEIRASNRPQGGAEFSVRLPLLATTLSEDGFPKEGEDG